MVTTPLAPSRSVNSPPSPRPYRGGGPASGGRRVLRSEKRQKRPAARAGSGRLASARVGSGWLASARVGLWRVEGGGGGLATARSLAAPAPPPRRGSPPPRASGVWRAPSPAGPARRRPRRPPPTRRLPLPAPSPAAETTRGWRAAGGGRPRVRNQPRLVGRRGLGGRPRVVRVESILPGGRCPCPRFLCAGLLPLFLCLCVTAPLSACVSVSVSLVAFLGCLFPYPCAGTLVSPYVGPSLSLCVSDYVSMCLCVTISLLCISSV